MRAVMNSLICFHNIAIFPNQICITHVLPNTGDGVRILPEAFDDSNDVDADATATAAVAVNEEEILNRASGQ